MPKEIRYILFSQEEVLEALVAGLTLGDPGWSEKTGPVRLDLASAASGEALARLVPRYQKAGQRSHWTFHASELLTLLLQACRRRRIPLPQRGHKRVELLGSGLCLSVMLSDAQAEPEVMANEIRYLDPALVPLLLRRV